MKARRIKGFFGFGFGVERGYIVSDDLTKRWESYQWKVMFGPFIVYDDIRRKPTGHSANDTQLATKETGE